MLNTYEEDALRKDGDSGEDFELELGRSVWLSVRNLSVNVRDTGEGVSVTIYGRGHEAEDSVAETWATWGDGTHCYKCHQLDYEDDELHYHEDDGELYCDSCYIDAITEDTND